MRIKRIDLNGFKSFMEPTVLELPAGVTAIVGPNGCGKSNVVDAIRWVLGEQSPRHLRGAAMEDIIFNGNAETGPLGMAEVSMLLERDEADLAAAEADEDAAFGGGLPPELARASEILVTRRYFRSGESEYFINRAPCRLRDITELFLGSGVGTRAYAIIEQGRVDQLINAKPEEMRLFIEEAAGTTRFRSRRIAAERKMQRTRDNLVRVQDVLREIERHMALLDRQARRATEYHRLRDELRSLDLRVMAMRHRAGTAEVAELQERLQRTQGEERDLQEDIRRSRGATSEAQAARATSTARLQAIEAAMGARRSLASASRSRAAAALARRDELAGRTVEAEQELGALEPRRAAFAAEVARLAESARELADACPVAEAAQQEAEAQARSMAAAGRPLESAVDETKDELLESLADEARLRNMVDALRQRLESLDGRRRKLDDEQRQLGERLRGNAERSEASHAAIERLEKEGAELDRERRRLQATLADLEERERAQTATVDAVRVELTGLRSRAESLRELDARYESCTRGVASLLERDRHGGDLLASVLRVPAELERAVAAALGVRLGQPVVPDTRAAIAAVRWLAEAAAGSATVVPRDPERRTPVIVPAGPRLLDRIEVDAPHWALAEALLGHVLLADDLNAALALWRRADHGVTVVTPQGEAIDPLGAVTGGSEPPLEETLLARSRELRDLEGTLARTETRLGDEEGHLVALGGQLAEAKDALASLETRRHGLDVALVAAQKDRDRFEAERARIAAELEVVALEAGGLAGEGGAMADEQATLDDRLRRAEEAASERRARLARHQEELSRWRTEYGIRERALTEASVRAAAVAERRRAADEHLARSEQARSEIESRVVELTRRLDEARVAADSAREQALEAEEAASGAEQQAATLDREREGIVAAIGEADALVAADDSAERAAQDRLEVVREERSRLDVALAEHRLSLEHIAAQLNERYGLGLSALAEIEPDDGADPERAERAETLRGRIARMGDVNPGAATELEELRARHDFLASQRTDLERSLDDLRRTISKLARTSRQRFDETFAAANERLAEVFPKLFPGGMARLDLVEREDGGDPGVEIVVQPAGKKLQSLSLLSGGEKALAACALILALFLIRPTPFCLLDEVDAPLDEANIGRFNHVIRELAAASQFVLITHNRRTMEAAHTLYGITMEQAGVSKVVSVRLSRAA